jgi:hypothetical protein
MLLLPSVGSSWNLLELMSAFLPALSNEAHAAKLEPEGRDSSIGIATTLQAARSPGIVVCFLAVARDFLFSTPSRPAIEPPVQCTWSWPLGGGPHANRALLVTAVNAKGAAGFTLRKLLPVEAMAELSPSTVGVNNAWSHASRTPYIFITWY